MWAAVLIVIAASISTGCAKNKPTATPTPPPPPRPDFVVMAAPEPIATPGIWFAFDPDFVRTRYRSADLAFGSLTIADEWRASPVHEESCSGEDGEVHVGVYDDHMGLDPGETLASRRLWMAETSAVASVAIPSVWSVAAP